MQRFVLGIFAVALAVVPAPAGAEWALDVYGGAAWTLSSDQSVSGTGSNGASVKATLFDVDSGTGFTAGGRAGYWFGFAPHLGVDFDFFGFRASDFGV